MRPVVNPEIVADYLQELLEADADTVRRLINYRIPCSQSLADHPGVQVLQGPDGIPRVGLLGILNGLCAKLGCAVADYDDAGNIVRILLEVR